MVLLANVRSLVGAQRTHESHSLEKAAGTVAAAVDIRIDERLEFVGSADTDIV